MNTIVKNHPTRKNTKVTHHIPTGFDQMYDNLMNYNGTFSFVLDMRNTMNRYGKLSDKQWAAVTKCLTPKPAQDPTLVLVESCDIPVTISASSARYIAKTGGWKFNPRTLKIKQIKSAGGKGFLVRATIDWSGNVSECRCCGKALTDWRSQATGVGPYCVKKTGIAYVRNQADVTRFQKDMEQLAASIGEFEVFIKSWSFDEKDIQLLQNAIQNSTPTKLSIPAPEIRIPIQYLDWDGATKTLNGNGVKLNLDGFFDPTNIPTTIAVDNRNTGKSMIFLRHAAVSTDGSTKYISTQEGTGIKLLIA